MQLVSYRAQGHTDARWHASVEHEGLMVDATFLWQGGTHETTARSLLATGPTTMLNVLEQARSVLVGTDLDVLEVFETASIELGLPVPNPDKISCIDLNYADHASEAEIARTEVPVFFAKFRNVLVGPSSPIMLPRVSREIDYKSELAVVTGKPCKDVSVSVAFEYVAGYSVFNDVSARDLQMQTSQWGAGKALNTFGPMGPGIVPTSEIPDPHSDAHVAHAGQRDYGARRYYLTNVLSSCGAYHVSQFPYAARTWDIIATGHQQVWASSAHRLSFSRWVTS